MTGEPVHLAIDPGSEESGWVEFILKDVKTLTSEPPIIVTAFGKTKNTELRKKIREHTVAAKPYRGMLCIEMPRAQGMAVANEVFQACVEVGRFLQTWGGTSWSYIFRADVKLTVCGSARAKDGNVRQSLIDIWGGEKKAMGGKRCTQCNGKTWTGRDHDPCDLCKATGYMIPPGPLKGMAQDMWAALGVAVTWAMAQIKTQRLKASPTKKSNNQLCKPKST